MEINSICQNRFQRILHILDCQSRVNVAELSQTLHVSPVTVRRDLDKLNDMGLVERIHGGAVAAQRRPSEVPFLEKTKASVREKQAIARKAASLVQDGDSIFLNSGSTTLHVLRFIKNMNVRVVTNNPSVVLLDIDPGIELIVIGGEYRRQSSSLVGDIAVSNLASVYCARAFLGVNGVSVEKGLTSSVHQETTVNRLMIEHAQEQVVILADSSKVNRVSTFFSAPITAAHTLITDSCCQPSDIEPFTRAGLHVLVA